MKNLSLIAAVCLCTSASAQWEPIDQLKVARFNQGQTPLCWAYCCLSVLHWYQVHITIEDVKGYATCGRDMGGYFIVPNCESLCSDSKCNNTVDRVLNHWGVPSESSLWQLYWDNVYDDIKNGRPVIAGYKKNGDDERHAVVIMHCFVDADGTKWIQYMNPASGNYDKPVRFNWFLSNNLWVNNGQARIKGDPTKEWHSTGVPIEGIREWANYPIKGTDGGFVGYQYICAPFSYSNDCISGQICSGTNVHNVESMLWFGNVPGATFSYPISFPKKGKYQIRLTCRGSVCAFDTYAPNIHGCEDGRWYLPQVKDIASVELSSSDNQIHGKSIIYGEDLDNEAYQGWDNWGNAIPFKCRTYTFAEKDVSMGYEDFEDEPLRELGDVVLTFEAVIKQPSVENVTVTLSDGPPGITGLSIHGIQTKYDPETKRSIPTTKEQKEESNFYNYSFTGSLDDFTQRCAPCWPGKPGPCGAKSLMGFEIRWGDGEVDTYGDMTTDVLEKEDDAWVWINDQYDGVLFTHQYRRAGTYTPYVRFVWEKSQCFWDNGAIGTSRHTGLPIFTLVDMSPMMYIIHSGHSF